MKITFTLIIVFLSFKVNALDPNHFTITRVTAPYFIVDGNSPATITKAYVGFEVKNNSNSGVTYSGLKFTITSIGTSVSGQNYSIVSPVNGIINVGTLSPGETKVCYYYISYPASITPQATFNIQLSDNTASSKTQGFNIYNRSSISANAGGTATQTITSQDVIGSIITDDVTYVVGNVKSGDESDFQVAVSPQFDPTKITLISTKVISSSVPGIPSNTTDSLYFISGNGFNGANVSIRWTFKITASNFTTYLLPCAGATSGSTNYKYALNTSLGQGTPVTVSASSNPLAISKISDQPIYLTNNSAVFTVTISNPSSYDVIIDKIIDQLPAGFIYQDFVNGTQITASISTSIPVSGASGTITFEGGVTSAGITSYTVPAGGTLILKYSAIAPSSPASNLVTTVKDYIGTTEVSSAQNTISVSAPLPLELISFKAVPQSERVKLEWTTAHEINSSHFEIERSNQNDYFIKIGEVRAAVNSYAKYDYFFIDSFPIKGIANYRLKMLDNDGSFKYSPIVSVSMKKEELTMGKIYTNPFTNEIRMKLTSTKYQQLQMQLVDMAGKVVAEWPQVCKRGVTDISITRLDFLKAGVYILHFRINDQWQAVKLVKL